MLFGGSGGWREGPLGVYSRYTYLNGAFLFTCPGAFARHVIKSAQANSFGGLVWRSEQKVGKASCSEINLWSLRTSGDGQ